jgi:hypothetical protein
VDPRSTQGWSEQTKDARDPARERRPAGRHPTPAARAKDGLRVIDDQESRCSAALLGVHEAGGLLEHAAAAQRRGVELTRLILGARLLILPGGHGDYLGEAVMTQKHTRSPELTARLIEEFLDSES